jgi:hypothetical protein
MIALVNGELACQCRARGEVPFMPRDHVISSQAQNSKGIADLPSSDFCLFSGVLPGLMSDRLLSLPSSTDIRVVALQPYTQSVTWNVRHDQAI